MFNNVFECLNSLSLPPPGCIIQMFADANIFYNFPDLVSTDLVTMSQRQDNVSEQTLPPSPTYSADNATKKKQRGRGAKSKSTASFVTKANQKYMAQQREAALKRLGVFNQDAAQLEQSLRSMMVTVQPKAIPLPVAIRGVGFTTVAEYSRLCNAWNADTVAEICTIYQYYRLSMFLIVIKVFHTRYVQHLEESFPLSNRFILNEEYRQVLQTVCQTPLSMYNITCTVGTVQGEAAYT